MEAEAELEQWGDTRGHAATLAVVATWAADVAFPNGADWPNGAMAEFGAVLTTWPPGFRTAVKDLALGWVREALAPLMAMLEVSDGSTTALEASINLLDVLRAP